YFAKQQAHQLSQAGLPDPAVLEVKEQQKPAVNDDVPVLQQQKSETTNNTGDVPPPAQEQK
ncbi:preprotein translocase subunit SecG, partial [Pseudomonas syringae]